MLGEELSTHTKQSEDNERRVSDGDGNRRRDGLKYSLKDTAEQEILSHYGKTYRWSETGYIYKDGTRLDLSGKREGARGGYRTVDHRDVFGIFEDGDTYGTDAMSEFISRGNIRVVPESPGITVSVEPTDAQYAQIQSLIETVGWKEKYFSVDIDDEYGDTIETFEYEGNVSARKIISDLKQYFKTGEKPYQSEANKFRYSLKAKQTESLHKRGVTGDRLLDCMDLADEIFFVGGEITDDAKAVLYHATTKENAEKINASGLMYGKEPDIYFSTKKDGEIKGYGDTVVRVEIPLEKLELNDVFKDEVHLTMRVHPYTLTNIKFSLKNDKPFAENVKDVLTMTEEEALRQKAEERYVLIADNTPEVILNNVPEAEDLQLIMRFDKLYLAVRDKGVIEGHYHDLGENFANLLKYIADPLLILQLDNGRLNIITSMPGAKGDNSLVSMELNAVKDIENTYKKYNLVVTAYSAKENHISNKIRENISRILYKKESLSQVNRQLSEWLEIINDKPSIQSISDSSEEVNNEIRYSKKNPRPDEDIIFYNTEYDNIREYAQKNSNKVYTRKEVNEIIDAIQSTTLQVNEEEYAELSGKSLKNVKDKLYVALNGKSEGERTKAALDIADYIVENAALYTVAEEMTQEGRENAAKYVIDLFKEYLHSVNLDPYKDDIKARYGDDRSIYLLWGKRQGTRGVSPDVIAQGISMEGKFEFVVDTPQDILFAMHDAYRKATAILKRKSDRLLREVYDKKTLNDMKQEIAREILLSYEEKGSTSRIAKELAKVEKQLSLTREKVYDERAKGQARDRLFTTIDRVIGLEKYKSADIKLSEEVVGFIKLFKKLKTWRDNVSKNAREVMLSYCGQTPSGKRLYDMITNSEVEENPYKREIEEIAHGNGELTTVEMQSLSRILEHFIHSCKEYDRIFFDGRRQSEQEIADRFSTELDEAVRVRDSGPIGLWNTYKHWNENPINRFRRLGNYDDESVIVKLYKDIQEGAYKGYAFKRDADSLFQQFVAEHKKEIASWREQKLEIDFNGKIAKISKGQIMSLLLSVDRQQGAKHIFPDGRGGVGYVRLADEVAARKSAKQGYEKGVDVELTINTIDEMENKLSDDDKAFMKLVSTFFNDEKYARGAFNATQKALYGVESGVEEKYFPLRVSSDQIYREIGNVNAMDFSSMLAAYSPSFAKATKENAKNKIVIENVLDVVERHLNQMASYVGLAVPLRTYSRLLNKKAQDNKQTIMTKIKSVDSSFVEYTDKLFKDLQGFTLVRRDGFSKAVSKLRSWGAKAALGANPKVWFNQVASLPAANAVGLKYTNMAKGLARFFGRKTDYETMFKYCPLAYERYRSGSTIDVGLLWEGKTTFEKFDAITDITTAPIQFFDKMAISAIWNASLEQTKKGSYEAYSEDHYKAAAELTNRAITETQPNYTVLQRPAILRSENELVRLSTQFMTQPLQNASLLFGGIEEVMVLRRVLKSKKAGTEEYEKAQGRLKEAKKKLIHKASAVLVETILLVAIAEAFKWLLGKDDDKELGERVVMDYVESTIGMFPIVKDAYSVLQGYDLSNMYYTGFSNIFEGVRDLYQVVDLAAKGNSYNSTTINGKLRRVAMGISQTFGIPLRNIENYAKGIIGHISESARLKYESNFQTFSNKSLSSRLIDAVKKGDETLADTVIGIMMKENVGQIGDKETQSRIAELVAKGYDVLPKSVGNKITRNGEEIVLTQAQKKKFMNIYAKANEDVTKLFKDVRFKKSQESVQATAIKTTYKMYYDMAVAGVFGEDDIKNALYAEAFDVQALSYSVAFAKSIEADVDRNGNAVAGTKKRKVEAFVASLPLTAAQKYMLMGYLGYKNKNGKDKVQSYINRLALNSNQKTTLLSYSGY